MPTKIVQLAVLLAGLASTGLAQPPPETDIYLADLAIKRGKVSILSPENVTNRTGYDNQPNFLPDGKSFFYTAWQADGQTDIYQYDLKTKTANPLTRTKESEYSAALTPDGKWFSTIRVEADGTQRLWKFQLADPGQAALVLEQLKPVGYYVWQGADQLVLFVLGEPNALYVADASTGQATQLESGVGRSFHRIPGDKYGVSFVHKISAQQWVIKRLDLRTRQITPLIETLPGCEDLAWIKDGTILLSQGSKVYQSRPQVDRTWTEVADFGALGIKQVTRLAVNPRSKKLTFVASK